MTPTTLAKEKTNIEINYEGYIFLIKKEENNYKINAITKERFSPRHFETITLNEDVYIELSPIAKVKSVEYIPSLYNKVSIEMTLLNMNGKDKYDVMIIGEVKEEVIRGLSCGLTVRNLEVLFANFELD